MRVLQRFLFLAVAPSCVFAQSPQIAAFTSSALTRDEYFPDGIRPALGGLATIFGSGLSDGIHQARSFPLPQQLGPTSAQICQTGLGCVPLSLLYVNPGQVNLYIPETLGSNEYATLVVQVGGSEARFDFELDAAAPGIFEEGYDCWTDSRFEDTGQPCGLSPNRVGGLQPTRGAVTDLKGHLIWSGNPARMNGAFSLWLTGLGDMVDGPPQTFGMKVTNVPVYGYSGDTWSDAKVLWVGHAPGFAGLYQANFMFPDNLFGIANSYPPLFPCGDYRWEVSLDVSDSRGIDPANLIQIPIVIENGDVACAK